MDEEQILISKKSKIGIWLLNQKKNSKTKKTYEQILNELYEKAEHTSFERAISVYSTFELNMVDLYPELEELLEFLRPLVFSKINKIKNAKLDDSSLDDLINYIKRQ